MMNEVADTEVSQAEFARQMGVSRAAVTQWKTNDILTQKAFTRPDKKGKLRLSIAIEQVRRNRDIGQSLGNGLSTGANTEPEPAEEKPLPDNVGASPTGEPAAPQRSSADLQRPVTIEDQLKQAKLEQQLRNNRKQAEEEALRQGQLINSDDARTQIARVSGLLMQIFEGSLVDFSKAVAAQFNLPQRDVQHLLKSEFRKVRETASMKQRVLAQQAGEGAESGGRMN